MDNLYITKIPVEYKDKTYYYCWSGEYIPCTGISGWFEDFDGVRLPYTDDLVHTLWMIYTGFYSYTYKMPLDKL